jgi:hypothetical protein
MEMSDIAAGAGYAGGSIAVLVGGHVGAAGFVRHRMKLDDQARGILDKAAIALGNGKPMPEVDALRAAAEAKFRSGKLAGAAAHGLRGVALVGALGIGGAAFVGVFSGK